MQVTASVSSNNAGSRPAPAPSGLVVSLATRASEVREAQALRYQVFAGEMGAQLHGAEPGLDQDHYDAYCHHLLVRDTVSGEVVACTRILTDAQAKRAGGFYSASEFQLGEIPRLPGKIMEVGRTCVHPAYRGGSGIGVLWSGLAQFMVSNKFDYLIGCASVPLHAEGPRFRAIYEYLKEHYLSPDPLRVKPRRPMPAHLFELRDTMNLQRAPALPPLLKAYVKLGAKVCGEPYWDAEFQVADIFILVARENLNARYVRHFLARTDEAGRRAFKLRRFHRPVMVHPPGGIHHPRNLLAALMAGFSRFKPQRKKL